MDTAMPRRQEALPWCLMAPSLMHAYIPKTNHRLEFPPRALPVGSAGIVHFMVDGTEQSWEWREREWAIANSPISNLSFSSSLQLLWAMERLSVPALICLFHNKSKVTSRWGESWIFASAARSQGGLVLSTRSIRMVLNAPWVSWLRG